MSKYIFKKEDQLINGIIRVDIINSEMTYFNCVGVIELSKFRYKEVVFIDNEDNEFTIKDLELIIEKMKGIKKC